MHGIALYLVHAALRGMVYSIIWRVFRHQPMLIMILATVALAAVAWLFQARGRRSKRRY